MNLMSRILYFEKLFKRHSEGYIELHTGNGHGGSSSGETSIRNFSTIIKNIGSGLIYTPRTATTADYITVTDSGIITVSYNDTMDNAGSHHGISVNSNQLTTSITAITAEHRKSLNRITANATTMHCSWTGYLKAGDIIRAHTDGTAVTSNQDRVNFAVAKINFLK